ncbi:MAG: hypothetical protein HW377_1010 [Actinobacteria bacterium]|nr:hypothetical protein [Actinomycetota bacterium]
MDGNVGYRCEKRLARFAGAFLLTGLVLRTAGILYGKEGSSPESAFRCSSGALGRPTATGIPTCSPEKGTEEGKEKDQDGRSDMDGFNLSENNY